MERYARMLKQACVEEFDQMTYIPARAVSQFVLEYGMGMLEDMINSYFSDVSNEVRSEDPTNEATDDEVNQAVNKAIDVTDKQANKLAGHYVRDKIEEESGLDLPDDFNPLEPEESIKDMIKDYFIPIVADLLQENFYKPQFTDPELQKIETRDQSFSDFAETQTFTFTDEMKREFLTGREVIKNVVEEEAIFTINGDWNGPLPGGEIEYKVTLKEQENKFYQVRDLGGFLSIVTKVLILIAGVIAVLVMIGAISASGGLAAAVLPALRNVVDLLYNVLHIVMPLTLAFLCITMSFTVPIIAPIVTEDHDSTLDTIESVIGGQSATVEITEMKAVDTYYGSPSSLSFDITNKEGKEIPAIVETLIISSDGRPIKSLKKDVTIPPNATLTVEETMSLRPGNYKAIAMVHTNNIAASLMTRDMAVEIPSISLTVNSDKSQYTLGETAHISSSVTNNEDYDVEDLMYLLEVEGTDASEDDTLFSLAAYATNNYSLDFVPEEEGCYQITATVFSGMQVFAEYTIGIVVGSDTGAVINTENDYLYNPGVDVVIPTTITNIGTTSLSSNIDIVTEDILNSYTEVYTNSVPISLNVGEETTQDITVLTAPRPGLYQTIFSIGEYDKKVIEYAVAADNTLFVVGSTDKEFYNVGETVNINMIVKDVEFSLQEANVTCKVLDPQGNENVLSVTGSAGSYSTSFVPSLTGTHEIIIEGTRDNYRVYGSKLFFIVSERSSLNLNVSNDLEPWIKKDLTVTVTNENGIPVKNVFVNMQGCGIEFNGLSDDEGKIEIAPTPTKNGEITITASRGGYVDIEITIVSYAPQHFPDVPPSKWFFKYIEYMYTNGMVSGYGDGTFKPYNP
ncbi:MAG: S-layer homology domain-containing protein, partial [Candidatus Thorarchaeota archaeon]